jgi:glucose-6-phosphate 1-dehydrogenase
MSGEIETLIIFGAGGDLAQRLLLPGLARLLASGRGVDLHLVGVDAQEMSDDKWQKRVLGSFSDAGVSTKAALAVAKSSTHVHADVTKPDELRTVLEAAKGTPALYFALPPHVAIAACEALQQLDLPKGTVLCLEKPFGTDLPSAVDFNRRLAKLVPEHQIHRVDHFLGKSTVLNLLGLRFANRVFENIWSAEHIESVDIIFDETLGLEGRAGYYDKAGALVDMVQSHLLLVLSLVAMEPPSTLEPDDLPGSMAQVLRATRVWQGDAAAASRRARYSAGTIGRRKLPSYVKEKGVDPSLKTETLAEVTFGVENWRWAGVPFTVRSGKALSDRRQEIVVTFKDVPHRPTGLTGDPGPARLRIALNPDGMQLDVNVNAEGNPFELDRLQLAVDFGEPELPAYGEVIHGILQSDPTLAVSADAIEQCWRIVAPVLEAWKKNAVPLQSYAAGSSGPREWRA